MILLSVYIRLTSLAFVLISSSAHIFNLSELCSIFYILFEYFLVVYACGGINDGRQSITVVDASVWSAC